MRRVLRRCQKIVSDGAEVRFTEIKTIPKIGGEDWEGPPVDGIVRL